MAHFRSKSSGNRIQANVGAKTRSAGQPERKIEDLCLNFEIMSNDHLRFSEKIHTIFTRYMVQ